MAPLTSALLLAIISVFLPLRTHTYCGGREGGREEERKRYSFFWPFKPDACIQGCHVRKRVIFPSASKNFLRIVNARPATTRPTTNCAQILMVDPMPMVEPMPMVDPMQTNGGSPTHGGPHAYPWRIPFPWWIPYPWWTPCIPMVDPMHTHGGSHAYPWWT